MNRENTRPRIGLFVTCLANVVRPVVAESALQLLEESGCRVEIPAEQTCCGQPAYNYGDTGGAMPAAKHTIELFEVFDYVVVPSGSCAGMIAVHYPRLLEDDPDWQPRAEHLAGKTYELTRFLREVADYRVPDGRLALLKGVKLAYHDSCSCLREAGVRQQPRELLRQGGVEVVDLEQAEVCCGFGGTFSTKLPAISLQMADAKLADAEATAADLLVAADLGCLLHLGGRVSRRAGTLRLRHVAEVLAGRSDVPPLGGGGGA